MPLRILLRMGVGECDCSKHIYGWVYLFRIHLWVGVGVCHCLKHFHRQMYLSRRHLWLGVTVESTFKGTCAILEYF